MHNIIFLDIDGVLNHELFYEKVLNNNANFINLPKEQIDIDTDKIKLLNELCVSINAKVVISSTWRINNTLEQLQQMFKFVNNNSNHFTKDKEYAIKFNVLIHQS